MARNPPAAATAIPVAAKAIPVADKAVVTPPKREAVSTKSQPADWRYEVAQIKNSIEAGISSNELSIARFMADKQIEGGVNLDGIAGSDASELMGGGKGRRYELGEVVAQGGMGSIIDARDMNLRRHIAMKVLLNPRAADKARILRFIEEAQITSQLEHPSIVPVHELALDQSGNVFYTMKFVKGLTLREIIKGIRDGDRKIVRDYPLSHLLTIFQKICDALAFAHSKRVIHRDLKPENVMIGEYGEVQVMDWGLAKVLSKTGNRRQDHAAKKQEAAHRGQADRQLAVTIDSIRKDSGGQVLKTLDGAIMGTPGYMAPEQATGKTDELDERTDIYALGAILYAILTLQAPIRCDDLDEFLSMVANGDITPPTDYGRKAGRKGATNVRNRSKRPEIDVELRHLPAGQIPDSLSAVAMKALALEPRHRYATVKALQKDIEAYQQGFATGAERAGISKQLRLLILRHKGVFATLAAMLLVMFAAMAVYAKAVVRERIKAKRALEQFDAEQRKRQADRNSAAPAMLKSARGSIAQEKWNDAVLAVKTAIDYDPGLAEARLLQVTLLFRLGKYEDAVVACQEYVERFPADRTAQRLLPVCEQAARYRGRGMFGESIQDILREQGL